MSPYTLVVGGVFSPVDEGSWRECDLLVENSSARLLLYGAWESEGLGATGVDSDRARPSMFS